ncbi:MAG: hypothetical protein ACLRQF_08405 [Thomasclavelia ramosa]
MKTKGYFLTILSDYFGFTPILIQKTTYSMGSNGITMAFFTFICNTNLIFNYEIPKIAL